MLRDLKAEHIYIATGYTDLRRGIDGLAAIVKGAYGLDPFEPGSVFLFCGRRSDRLKALCWEEDGFCLAVKRLNVGRFQWPRNPEEARKITPKQYERLMQGLAIVEKKTIPDYPAR